MPRLPPTVTFLCPLCREDGRRVRIRAELDESTSYLTVGDLSGCVHADAFGRIGPLALEHERRLIHAALAAAERARRSDPDSACSEGR